MDTNAFVALVKDEAARLDLELAVLKNRGKGSHRMVCVGARKSTVPWTTADLPLGTRRAILRQLRLDGGLRDR